jgi:hypothetical protein
MRLVLSFGMIGPVVHGITLQEYCDLPREDTPMTLHIVLLPVNEPNTLVWIAETLFPFGAGSVAAIEKITYIESHSLACSSWGNYGLTLRDELARRIGSDEFDLSSPDRVVESLRGFCGAMISVVRPNPSQPSSSAAVLLATFLGGVPRLYWGQVSVPPVASELEMGNCLGDEINPAMVFVDYYYERSGRTVEEALSFGIHAMRLAHEMKRSYIGEPDAWVYRDGLFRRLTSAEMARYKATSEAIDASILQKRALQLGG